MSTDTKRRDGVVVVGAGLAGLAAAAYVAAAGHPVTVHERRNRVGGRATTDDRNGFRFNQGPHALYGGGQAERVLRELGVEVSGGNPSTKFRIWFDGEHEEGPAGAGSLVRTRALRTREKAEIGKILARLPRLEAAAFVDRTVDEWVADVTTTERTSQFLHAIVRLASYANHPAKMSADAAIWQIQRAMQHGVTYVDGGWQTLVDQLRTRPGVEVVGGSAITELPDARAVIVATGGPVLAGELLGTTFDVGPAAQAACLDLGITSPPVHDVMLGGDVPLYFSHHSAVARLAPPGKFHVAAAQYLGLGDEPDRAAIRAFALDAGIAEESIVEERFLHRMTTITAVPVARTGGMAGRPTVDATGLPNVFVAGDWVGPDGHLTDATLASARAAALAAIDVVERATSVA